MTTKNEIELRQWREDDWPDFRRIRLQALQTNPSVFLKSYDEEASQPDSYWIDCLSSENSAVFGLYDAETVIGLTGAFRYRESPHDTVILGMSFIHPDYRGRGLSELFYQARIDWARSQEGITRVIVSHRDGNEASKAANQKFGFVATDSTETVFPDGALAKEYNYELKI